MKCIALVSAQLHTRRYPSSVLLVLALALGLCTATLSTIRAATGQQVPKPVIPEKVFRISGYGAKGDGTTNDSKAIQAAIDAAAAAGGGRVVIPAGKFLSGPIELRSKIDLHLEKGATLLMSQNVDDFPVERNNRQNFIRAKGAEDIRISGPGTIDGQGDSWWRVYLVEKNSGAGGPRRPQMIRLDSCERIELVDFTSINPPNTHCSIRDSSGLTISRVKMMAPDDSPNTDAINLSRVKNAIITESEISTGDDNLVLLCGEGGAEPAVENIVVRDCKFGFGHGMSIGSFTAGGVQNVLVENLSFDGTTSGIRLKSGANRGGGLVKNITYRNITMKKVRYPIYLTSYYPKTPNSPADDLPVEGSHLPEWRDILIEKVTVADCPNSIIIWGLPKKRVEGLVLKNVKIAAERGAVVFHANATFSGVEITPASGPALQTYNADVKGMESVPFQGEFKAK
jgi:polygalacturonase